MTDELTVTPASEWGIETVRVRLPSGKVADLRKSFPSYMLARSGKLDADMESAMALAFQGKLNDTQRAIALTDLVVTSMMISPKVGPDGISLDAIDEADLEFIMARAFGGTPEPGFRDNSGGDGDRDDREGVVDDAVESAGNGAGDGGSTASRSSARGKAAGARAAKRTGGRAAGGSARAQRKAA